MSPQLFNLAFQRHDLDIADTRRHVTITRPRTALSARLGHLLVGAGSRLAADRPAVGRTH
jgi:hypothetical protein